METRKIGSLDVTVVGVGCNNFGRRINYDQTEAVVKAALDAGINFFDTADVYGAGQSETYLGRALGSRRKDVIIATKFGNNMEGQGQGASPAYIRTAVEVSLQRLGTDYIDLYQLHKPDANVPIAETLGELNELVREGKVREIGSSNFSAPQIREAEAASANNYYARFVSVQNDFSLLNREAEAEVLPECERSGIAFLPYFPLFAGMLTGKYRRGQPAPEGSRLAGSQSYASWLSDDKLARVEALIQFAEANGHTILELAISWLLAHPVVASVIAGATTPEQIRANVAAAGWNIPREKLGEIDMLLASAV